MGSSLKRLRSTDFKTLQFFSAPMARTHQDSKEPKRKESTVIISYCLKTSSFMWPSALPPQRCNIRLCIFPSFSRLITLVSLEFGVSLNSKRRQTKTKQHNELCKRKFHKAIPFAIMYSEDKGEKGALRQALSSLSKALFFNDSSAFRCKASLFRRGKLPLCC